MSGYVYMISDGKYVKIGHSADPAARLRSLQTGSATELHLLAQWPGTQDDERKLHGELAQYREVGEWFALPPRVLVGLFEAHRDHGERERLVEAMTSLMGLFDISEAEVVEAAGRIGRDAYQWRQCLAWLQALKARCADSFTVGGNGALALACGVRDELDRAHVARCRHEALYKLKLVMGEVLQEEDGAFVLNDLLVDVEQRYKDWAERDFREVERLADASKRWREATAEIAKLKAGRGCDD